MVVKIQKNHFVFSFNNLENKYKGFINMNSSQSFHIMLEQFVMLRIFQNFAHLFQNYVDWLFVFSHSMEGVNWKNSKLLKEINPEEIVKMKQGKGKNILVIGSASIVQQLTNLGLIDEYHLLVHPVVLGSGKPLFKDIRQKHDIKLLEAKTFSNGVVMLRYAPYKIKGKVLWI